MIMVIAIILILAGMVLGIYTLVKTQSARTKAKSEINQLGLAPGDLGSISLPLP